MGKLIASKTGPEREARARAAVTPAKARAEASADLSQVRDACPCGGGCPRCVPPPATATRPAAEWFPSPGTPLPACDRTFFEDRFAADFSRVRLHTGGAAARAAENLGARAFTLGQDIAVGPEPFAPETREGKTILGHELAHVVQQSRNGKRPSPGSRRLEEDAQDAAAALRGEAAAIEGACAPGIQCVTGEDLAALEQEDLTWEEGKAGTRDDEKQRSEQRRQERQYARGGLQETGPERARRELERMLEEAKSGRLSSLSMKNKEKLERRFKQLLDEAQLRPSEKSPLQGEYDEALRTPREGIIRNPQEKHVAGSPELPIHDLPTGQASYAQPDYSIWYEMPSGARVRAHVNLKSHRLEELGAAEARRIARDVRLQAIANVYGHPERRGSVGHLPNNEVIVISFAERPGPEIQDAIVQELFTPESPIVEVRFGSATRFRDMAQNPLPRLPSAPPRPAPVALPPAGQTERVEAPVTEAAAVEPVSQAVPQQPAAAAPAGPAAPQVCQDPGVQGGPESAAILNQVLAVKGMSELFGSATLVDVSRLEFVGRGSGFAVYRGVENGQPVAYRVRNFSSPNASDQAEMFREAVNGHVLFERLGWLRYRGIAVTTDGRPAIKMEYLEGFRSALETIRNPETGAVENGSVNPDLNPTPAQRELGMRAQKLLKELAPGAGDFEYGIDSAGNLALPDPPNLSDQELSTALRRLDDLMARTGKDSPYQFQTEGPVPESFDPRLAERKTELNIDTGEVRKTPAPIPVDPKPQEAPMQPAGPVARVATGLGVAGGLLAVANDILAPWARVQNSQTGTIKGAEARIAFWTEILGKKPETGYWDAQNNKESLRKEVSTGVGIFSNFVYPYIKELDVRDFRKNLLSTCRDYPQYRSFLRKARETDAIFWDKDGGRIVAAVNHEAGVKVYDLTEDLVAVEEMLLLKEQAAIDAAFQGVSRQKFRLKSASLFVEPYGEARIVSAAATIGPQPMVVLDQVEDSTLTGIANLSLSAWAQVRPANLDAYRALAYAKFQLRGDLHDWHRKLKNRGIKVDPEFLDVFSPAGFRAAPQDAGGQFGAMEYRPDPELPSYWTVGYGELRYAWVKREALEAVEEPF